MTTVLAIEDDPAILRGLADNLRFEGYEVITAADGETGYRLQAERKPDLILLDLMLPRMSGLEFCRKLRGERIQTPVLMLTARSEEADRVLGLDLGADDYMAKPFSVRELMARVRALLRRGLPSPERLSIGDLVMDCARRRVQRAGEPVDLAPKEYSILEYLLRNRSRPLSRTMIVEHVWDMEYDGLTNIVDVYIRHLRSKIDDRFPVKLIHTVRGIGYMLDINDKAGE